MNEYVNLNYKKLGFNRYYQQKVINILILFAVASTLVVAMII